MSKVVIAASAAVLSMLSIGCQMSKDAKMDRPDYAGVEAAKQQFLSAWTKPAGQPFSTDKLKAVIGDEAFLSFDGMAQQKTVLIGATEYLGVWGPGMNGFTTARVTEHKPIRTWTKGDLGITTSLAGIYAEMPDGNKIDTLGHLTLVFQRINGAWRVVHEHMSLGVKP
jgi:ketosteroid isomerase-like protein